MNRHLRLASGIAAAGAALALGVLAAMPIYATARLWLVAAAALALGALVAWASERWRFGLPVIAGATLVLFTLTVVPVAVPDALGGGLFRGLLDGLAAVVLGWKQLLTLTLPVGSYRTVLVPAYVVFLVTALLTVWLSQRSPRRATFAAIPMLAPVAFGTIFGASQVSAPLHLGPLTVAAPREIGLWLAAAVLAAVWMAWTSGTERRAALKLGRAAGGGEQRHSGVARALVGAAIVVIALLVGAVVTPMLDSGDRAVARDQVDPEIVVRDRPSPLASYRTYKRDDTIDVPLFSVTAHGALPARMRLAALDAYDGVDFHVGDAAAGRFIRFPSGERLDDPSRVSVRIDDGYADIWAPTARLGSPPTFTGSHAAALADGFYVNSETGAAIAVPSGNDTAQGLQPGDGYTAEMEVGGDPGELGGPVSRAPTFDLDSAPELAAWLKRQQQSADEQGLTELIERLRQRGYLSHAMTDGEGNSAWLTRLSEQYGTQFESSAGGHSLARLETLFAQLNAQQVAAGEQAKPAQLVAGIGDDEQFAAAAALVARALGYDSRVVLGVRMGGEDAGVPGVPACAEACTGDHLAAWIEVRGDAGVWVPFDASPQLELRPQRIEQGEQLPEFPTKPEERDAREADPPIGLGEQGDGSDDQPVSEEAHDLGELLRGVLLAAAGTLLVVIPVLFLPVAKRVRSKRRRRETVPELRAIGAWEELVDRARDAGAQVPAHGSRAEIAAALGTPPAKWAAAEVDRAVFSASGIGEEEAALLWKAVETDSAERAAQLGFWQRVRAAYSLRSYGIGGGRSRRSLAESENA